jgi:hypothetical protein
MTFDQWWKHIFGDKKIPDWIHETVVRNAYEAAVLAEREACAKVCEDLIGTRAMARHCADAIRARGGEK